MNNLKKCFLGTSIAFAVKHKSCGDLGCPGQCEAAQGSCRTGPSRPVLSTFLHPYLLPCHARVSHQRDDTHVFGRSGAPGAVCLVLDAGKWHCCLSELKSRSALLAQTSSFVQVQALNCGTAGSFLAQALTPPPPASVQATLERMKVTGVLEEDESLTPLGKRLVDLPGIWQPLVHTLSTIFCPICFLPFKIFLSPVDVQSGKMLVYSAIFKCISPIATICAVNSSRSPFVHNVSRRNQAYAAMQVTVSLTAALHCRYPTFL